MKADSPSPDSKKGIAIHSRLAIRLAALASILVAAAAVAVAAPQAADAASTASFNTPGVTCSNGGRMEVSLPTTLYPGSGWRYENVRAWIYIFKNVGGSWKLYEQSSVYYQATAVSSGVVSQAGWYPNGNYLNFGAFSDTHWLSGGEFRAAIYMKWMGSGASAYVWAGTHYTVVPWDFYAQAGSTCSFS